MGVVTIKNAPSKSLLFVAAIPFLFAIQQFSEGLLWYNTAFHPLPKIIFQLALHAFLTFAFLIWPIWIPFSLLMAEVVPWRKNIIAADLFLGIGLSITNLSFAMNQEVSAQIMNHSVQYIGTAPNQALLYPFIVIFPCFISSLKNISIFGVLILLSYLVAEYFYENTFVSVWCFFAAIISILIYKILRDNQTYPAKDLPRIHSN